MRKQPETVLRRSNEMCGFDCVWKLQEWIRRF